MNYPENSIIYINQAYFTVENNKKMFYADHYIIGQIIETLNPPENITKYVCKDWEKNQNMMWVQVNFKDCIRPSDIL